MAEGPLRRNRAALLAVKLALAAAVLAWLASRIDLARFVDSIRGAAPLLLAAAVACVVADDLLVTHKWRRLLQGLGLEIGFFRLFRVYLKGRFLGYFIPSSVATDLYKGAVLTRDLGTGKAVASSIILERLLGLVSIATISAVALGALPATILGVSAAASVAAAVLATAGGLAVFLHADRLAVWTLPHLPRRAKAVGGFLHELAAAFSAYRGQVRLLAETFLLSLAIQVVRSAGVWVLARSIDDATPYVYFLLLVPYVFLVNLLPVASSRVGLEQGVFVVLFSALGMRPETALAISLLSVATSFVAALPGGFWLLEER
jgi:uncharacterized protein (TIRG00374 family)